jgi:hypothetical protein
MLEALRKSALGAALLVCSTVYGVIEARAQGDAAIATVQPDPPDELRKRHAPISLQARIELMRKMSEFRNAVAAQARGAPPAAAPEEPVAPPQVPTGFTAARRYTAVPARGGDLVVGRNAKNLLAAAPANSTLAEPAAVNWFGKVLYAGNYSHLERSTNHGVSYANIAVPAGPKDAPIACCDNDIVIDDKGVAYHSLLYVGGAGPNKRGVVRIFVRPQSANFNASCSYTHDPDGAADNIVPDYPHIALSKNYLYLTYQTREARFTAIRRYNLAQLRNCQAVTVNTFKQDWGDLGQRVWTPAEGGGKLERMMWIQHESSNQIRIFEWLESSATVTSVLKTVQASSFVNPDCRGGIGNHDFIQRPTSWSISGFRTRCTMAVGPNQPPGGVLACYWHSAPIGKFPNAHIRAAHFSITTKDVLSQPHIWSRNHCFAYPAVSSNQSGAIGYSVAFGGKAGGGGPAVRGAVGVLDRFGRDFRIVADGIAMRPDGRYGDYVTIRPYRGCTRWFGATSYAWASQPVDAGTDVNARWVEFGRRADRACWSSGQ